MGFYDCCCMITGINLHAIEATAVLIRRSSDGYEPITLGITGTYDRLGSIDNVREDANSALILAHFRGGGDGRVVLGDDVGDIDDLLWLCERNCLSFHWPEHQPTVTLDGDRVFLALIAQPVWNALAATAPSGRGSADPAPSWFGQLFAAGSIAPDIYRGRLAEVADRVRQQFAVAEFVTARGLTWAPSPERSQRYPTEGGQYQIGEGLDVARHDYRDVAPIVAALAEYEEQIAPWLE